MPSSQTCVCGQERPSLCAFEDEGNDRALAAALAGWGGQRDVGRDCVCHARGTAVARACSCDYTQRVRSPRLGRPGNQIFCRSLSSVTSQSSSREIAQNGTSQAAPALLTHIRVAEWAVGSQGRELHIRRSPSSYRWRGLGGGCRQEGGISSLIFR